MPPPPPPSQQQHSRIDLSELKAQIAKKLGPERSQRYFNCLNRFFSHRLGKAEFDKLCCVTLGRENLPLHNQLIRSILKNAYHGRIPPPPPDKEVQKSVKVSGKGSPLKEDGYPQSRASPGQTMPAATSLIWGNGDVLPMSPRKVRSGIRDRRFRDRPSPLGRNGKTDLASHSPVVGDDIVGKGILENGDLNSCDLQRPMQHHQERAEPPENEQDILLLPPAKRPGIKRSLEDTTVSVHSKCLSDVVEVGEQAEWANAVNATSSPIRAPLGIPFCSASLGGTHRTLTMSSSSSSFANSGELSDSETLKKRIEQIVGDLGLNGVSTDCANLLNNGLDTYLKQLIRSCIELAGAKSGKEPIKHLMGKQLPHRNAINGVLPGHHGHTQSRSVSGEVAQDPKIRRPISLLDFKVAMELNPQQLGEDWPLLLEKICLHSCEE